MDLRIKKEKIKIILIDDDEIMRALFRNVFWIHGDKDVYDVKIFVSLEDAKKQIDKESFIPDIIFLDIMIPLLQSGDCMEEEIKRSKCFIEKLKSEYKYKNTKIIVYSDQKEKSIKEEVSKLGADGYIIKGNLMPKEIVNFVNKIYESNNKN
ncbi:MAG: response regulator [Burkholderiales bacterium]|nr:response regulator [Burkholderiales bacterium]